MKVRLLSLLLSFSFATGGSFTAFAEDSQESLFKPATTSQIDQFIDTLRSSVPLAMPPQNTNEQVDGMTAGFWAGSKTKVVSSLGPLILRFRPKTDVLVKLGESGGVTENVVLDKFDVTLTLRETRILIEHSHFQDRQDAGGILARIDKLKDPTRSAFIPGIKQSGLYVSIPVARDPVNNWGVFVCPREISYETSGGTKKVVLSPSSYHLSEVFFTADLNAQATLATAGQKGRVSVDLFVSPGLPPTKGGHDEAISTVPSAGLLYAPNTPFDFFRFAPAESIQEGLVARVEMQNKAGYIRRNYFSHQRIIKKTDEPSPVSLVIGRSAVSRDTGECYIIFEQRYSWMTYDKQPANFQ